MAGAVLALAGSLHAQELVKNLYSGDAVAVTWENTLTIGAENFEDVNAGNYIQVNLADATDVIEFKADGAWLPGSILSNIAGKSEAKLYLTEAGVQSLRSYGLELCGASFTVTSVEVYNDGFAMPEGAIWGGYFWVDNWNTMDLYKTAFDNYDNQRYLEIYLSDDNGDNTSYVMNVMTAFDNPAAVWGDASKNLVRESKRAIVDLENIDVKAALADVNALLIQSNPEGGNSYNITAVALTGKKTSTSAAALETAEDTLVDVYNLQGMAVRRGVTASEAVAGLPAGIYIAGGRKFVVR